MFLLWTSLAALACPTLATGTTSPLSFDTAQVAIVRQGLRTTFSVSINPTGDPQDFALVMPVPEVLSEDEIQVLDPEIFARLDGYTGPRHVEDAGCTFGGGGGRDCGGGEDGIPSEVGAVSVEAEYTVAEYEVVILSATESAGLFEWLDSNGYHLAEGVDERLQEYIDAGMYFLAAKLREELVDVDGTQLSPLQLSYEHPVFTIPLRLAVLNSPGEQNMVIYALTDLDERGMDGRVGISNYPEFAMSTGCIWGDSSEDFGAFYEERFTEAWSAVGDAGWIREYAGAYGDCSPCSTVWITEEDLLALGFESTDPGFYHHMTRLRMRYTADQINEDLMLYGSGIYSAFTTSFADDTSQNRSCISQCDEVYGSDGGGSDGGSMDGGSDDGGGGGAGDDGEGGVDSAEASDGPELEDWTPAQQESKGGCGCQSAASGGLPAAGLLGLVALLRRRRA